MIYASYPFEGGGGGVPIYPTFASFPAGTTAGDLAVAADTGNLYEWTGSAWQQIAGPGAALALGAFGSTPNANGLSLTGGVLNMQPADATHSGGLSVTDWNIFNNKQPAGSYITALSGDVTAAGPGSVAATLATVNTNVGAFTNASVTVNAKGLVTAASSGTTGNLTDVGTDGIVVTGGAGAVLGSGTSIAQHVADSTHNGYLSSTDWSTFNGKQAAGNYITALTGDITAAGPGSSAATLATVNTNVGAFASVTVNGKGLVTAATALSGDATTSGAALTLATVNTNTGSWGSSTAIPNFTVNGKGLITAAGTNVVIAPAGTLSGTTLNATVVSSSLTSVGTIATGVWNGTKVDETHGGTNQSTYTTGDILYASGANTLSKLAAGSNGTILTMGASVPAWQAAGSFTVVTKTGTYSIANTDGLVLCSSAAFTVTLPTAASISGTVIRVKKTDASLTNIITVATTSAQTIDGNSTVTLNTQNEEWTFVSDGSNWQVLDRYWPANNTSYTPSITATVSNPTFGTHTFAGYYWRSGGDEITVNANIQQSTAGTNGTGVYLVALPGSLTANTTVIPLDTNGSGLPGVCIGSGLLGTTSVTATNYSAASQVVLYNSTNITLIAENAVDAQKQQWGSSGFPFGGTTVYAAYTYKVKISGWTP